jgi:hypothetical protein
MPNLAAIIGVSAAILLPALLLAWHGERRKASSLERVLALCCVAAAGATVTSLFLAISIPRNADFRPLILQVRSLQALQVLGMLAAAWLLLICARARAWAGMSLAFVALILALCVPTIFIWPTFRVILAELGAH